MKILSLLFAICFSFTIGVLVSFALTNPREGKRKWGVLFRWQSWWIGAHYSDYNKRLCVNLIPLVTIWIAAADGKVPEQGFDIYRNDQTFSG